MVPSGTAKSKFLEPLIKGSDDLVGCFDELLLVHVVTHTSYQKKYKCVKDGIAPVCFSPFHRRPYRPDEPTTGGRQPSPHPPAADRRRRFQPDLPIPPPASKDRH
jgi:hypothetical protein